MVAVAGSRLIRDRVALVTVSVADPVTPMAMARMVVLPGATPLAVLPIRVTTVIDELDHMAVEVRSTTVPSEKRPMAVNETDVPMAALGSGGVTSMLVSVRAALSFG